MNTKLFRTIVVFLTVAVWSPSVRASYFNDSIMTCDVDPVILRLDSMSYSLFTRDKFFVADDELLASINMPAELIPRYSDAEIKEKLKLIPSVFQLTYNAQVKQFIDLFAYKRRGLMARCLANGQIYFPIFEEILDRKGLPIELKYLPVIESAFNPIAISKAGATGLWQMMYGTGAMMGLQINSYIDERRDPVKATEAATDYLKMLYNMYGDWQLVLAAYNSGPGNVNKAIARAGGIKNFWAIMNYLPAETRSYVPTYIAAVYVLHYHNDFKLVSAEPKRELYVVDTVVITSKVSLKHICNNLSIAEDELQFLNPSVKLGIIPYTKNGFPLNLPVSYFALFESRKEDIMNDSSMLVKEDPVIAYTPKTIWHKVSKNQTLSQVAAKYGVSVSSIKKWNNLKSSTLYYGQKLKVITSAPAQAAVSPTYAQAFASKIIEKKVDTASVQASADGEATTEVTNSVADSVSAPITAVSTTKPTDTNKCVYYVVQPGDTLWGIAERYDGVSVAKLKEDNKAIISRPLRAGDVLKIFM